MKRIWNKITHSFLRHDEWSHLVSAFRLLLLTTMTMMAATELHNPQMVDRKKVWTREKFATVGITDCGISAVVMKKIFDRIREFPNFFDTMGEGST